MPHYKIFTDTTVLEYLAINTEDAIRQWTEDAIANEPIIAVVVIDSLFWLQCNIAKVVETWDI